MSRLIFSLLIVFWGPLVTADPGFESLATTCNTQTKPTINADDIVAQQERGRFPRGSDSVSLRHRMCHAYQIPLLRLNNETLNLVQAAKRKDETYAIDIAADLNSRVKALADRELQEADARRAQFETCTKKMVNNEPPGVRCADFNTRIFPLLKTRYRVMRQLLAIAIANRSGSTDDLPLRHLIYTGSSNDPNAKMFEIAPLTSSERERVNNEIKNTYSREGARERYLRLLSQSPEFLLLKGEVLTPSELLSALRRPAELSRSLKEEEYIHIDGALLEVLKTIPEERRADYCVVAEALRKNKELQTNYRKFLLNLAAAPLTFASMTVGIVSSLAVTGPAETAIEASLAAEQTEFKFELCLRSTIVDNPRSPNSHLCDFLAIQDYADQVLASTLYKAVTGDPASSKMRILRETNK